MHDDDVLLDELIKLGKAAERVRERRARSSSTDEVRFENRSATLSVLSIIKPKDILQFEGGAEEIEAERLIRIIANASASSERIATYFHELVRDSRAPRQVTAVAAQRYSIVLRDSMNALSNLLGGYRYVQKTPEWNNLKDDDNE